MAVNTRYKQNRLQQLRGFLPCGPVEEHLAGGGETSAQPAVGLAADQSVGAGLGAQLFERRGPRISLTHDGQRLLELARPLVEAIDSLEESFSSLRESAERGIVKVAAGGSTIQYLLPPFVEKYSREHPQVDIRLHNVTGKSGLELLREGEVDFAIGPMLDTPPDIEFHPLVTYEPMLITRLDHPLAKKKQVTLKDVAAYPLILPPKNLSTHNVVESVFAEHQLEHDVKLEVGGYDVIKRYVGLGLGISIVMSHCLSGADQLHTAPMRKYFPTRTYGVVLRKGKQLSPAASRFVETLREDAGSANRRKPRNGTSAHKDGSATTRSKSATK